MIEKKPFLLRLSPELYEALARWAADELRSLNGQIEFLLRAAVVEARRSSPPAGGTRTPARRGGRRRGGR